MLNAKTCQNAQLDCRKSKRINAKKNAMVLYITRDTTNTIIAC